MTVRPDRRCQLRRALERLDGLPLRPITVRALLRRSECHGRSLADAAPAGFRVRLDPGWALAELNGELARLGPLGLAARRRWWPCTPGEPAAEAIERLWRHGVATSWVAERAAREDGIGDPGWLARIGLIHALGLWGLAAVAPEELARLVRLSGPERRRAERALLGTGAANVGRELARRWGCPAAVVEALWLHDDDPEIACASQPTVLRHIRRARTWADRTPWSLADSPGDPGPPPRDPRHQRLVLAVQSACRAPFVAGDATPAEARLAQCHARLLRRHQRLAHERAECRRFVRALTGPRTGARLEPVEPDWEDSSLRAAWQTWRDRGAALARLSLQLDAIADAYRARAGSELKSRSNLASLAEFAAGAAHELNNPLAVILGRAQLLLGKDRDDPEANRSLRAIIGQTQRATRMLRDLIYVARPPAPRPRHCQPDEVLRAAARDLQDEATVRRVRLRAELAEPLVWSWTDPDGLRHLADVLIRNALEASPEGGTVTLSARSREDELSWTVHNRGRPITAQERRHLFDPFFCGRQAGRGLGMGLARAARFVAGSGGQIRGWSDRDRGTHFHVQLPLPRSAPEGERSPPGAGAAALARTIGGNATAKRAFPPLGD